MHSIRIITSFVVFFLRIFYTFTLYIRQVRSEQWELKVITGGHDHDSDL